MINKTLKKSLLKVLGKKHISKIMKYAEENDLTKENGRGYSQPTYSRVFNGEYDHPEVEKIIIAAADHYLTLNEKEKAKRKAFVNKINNNNS